jgi:hypothetical protein
VAEPDAVECLGGTPAAFGQAGPSGVQQAVGDVVQRGGVFGEEELLEDEADVRGALGRQRAVVHGGGVPAGDPYGAGAGPVEGAHEMQQGRLSRPRGAGDAEQLASSDGEAHAAQRLHGAGVGPGHRVEFQNAHVAGTTTR